MFNQRSVCTALFTVNLQFINVFLKGQASFPPGFLIMAPRIKVPANFGREHINSEVHGNLILNLKDGGKIKTNSMIMSLNSPVIDNLTTNLSQVKQEL